MKKFISFSRFLVGLLFIFSGLIKANDPLGLSYKMQEFFEAWHTPWLNQFSLASSIGMNIIEVVAGVAIIIGWKSKLFSRLLFVLITFFTFLTSYVLFSGKFTACGCFGDCLPLTPIQTFLKDLILFVLIIFLLLCYKEIKPLFNNKISILIVFISLVFTSLFQWFVLKNLPVLDCLPYKQNNNILQQMQPPPNSKPDSVIMYFNYIKDGKKIKIDASNFPDDFDSTYVQVGDEEKVIIRKGNNTPKIADFTLYKLYENKNLADSILGLNKNYVLIFVKKFPEVPVDISIFLNWKVIENLQQQSIPIFIVTSDVATARKIYLKNIDILKLDATVLKTAARVNPTYFLMNGATILQKVSGNNADLIIKYLLKNNKS